MTRKYICSCENCLQTHPNGKSVGKTTYSYHRDGIRGPRPRVSKEDKYRCRCHLYPNGHYLLSRASYHRHRAYLRRAKNPATAETIDSESDSVPSDDTEADQAMSSDISSDMDSLSNGGESVDNSEEEPEEDSDMNLFPSVSVASDNSDASLHGNLTNVDTESDLESGAQLPSSKLKRLVCFKPNDYSDHGGDELFLTLAEWGRGVPRDKYTALQRLLRLQGVQFPSLRRQSGRLQRLTTIKPTFFHCCQNNCIAFTGEYADLSECPYCEENRFSSSGKAQKTFIFIPLIPRLRLQYRAPSRAKALKAYRQSLSRTSSSQAEVRDFFDGDLFREYHVNELGLFNDSRDVALHMSLEGVQLAKKHNHEVTPVVFMNLNLPPDQRYEVKNMLTSLLIPGPKRPKAIDTFLRPLVDELLLLEKGVPAIDAHTGTVFQLRAWVTMVTGDGPALADAIGMKRPGDSIRPCRTCSITAEKSNEKSKTYNVPHSSYNFNDPPLRTDLRKTIRLVEKADSEKSCQLTGVSRSSVLLELKSLHFPRSFPADVMHLILQNVAPLLYGIWSRTKLAIDNRKNANFVSQPYHLDGAVIKGINSALANAQSEIPTFFGHVSHPIDNAYKAAEWDAWLKLLGVPLLSQQLEEPYVENFRVLSQIYTLATRRSLTHVDVDLLEALVVKFVKSFETLYFGGDPQRLPVCAVDVHYLLHLPLYIRDCGPSRYWWQFPMERLNDILKPKTRSKSQLSTGAANALMIAEHINHMEFIRPEPVKARPTKGVRS